MSYKVPSPMKRPDYVFYEKPTVEQLRARAVEAMHDFLGIRWKTHQKIAHNKKGAVSGKRFIYEAENTYAGIPYTEAGMGLFQFLEYYDEETGRLKFYGTGEEFNKTVGGTCACGVCWSLATVCHSVSGCFINFFMTPKNGYYPVGDYFIPTDVDDYRHYHTSRIVEEAGVETILEAYAKTRPGDAVCSSVYDHTMMIIAEPEVVRDENGKIDPTKSALTIADQQGGNGVGFYDSREGDELIHASGRKKHVYSFSALVEKFYIPVAPAEFLGKEPYARAEITLDRKVQTREDLVSSSVLSNYPMALLKVVLEEKNGRFTTVGSYFFNRRDPHSGLARCYPLENLKEQILSAEGKSLILEVTASNGEIIRPVTLSL